MQERYCECGRSILVHYFGKGLSWLSHYFTTQGAGNRSVRTCPRCGRLLDIDSLL